LSKVIKGYQVKVDPEAKIKISTVHQDLWPTPQPAPTAGDSGAGAFTPLNGEDLATERMTATAADAAHDDLEPGMGPDGEPPAGGAPGSGPATPPPQATPGSRAPEGGASPVLLRRQSELDAFERQLQEWEDALLAREKRLDAEEQQHLQELHQKRVALGEETDKLMAMARKNAETLLENARVEAANIKRAVELETESVREKARREGYALGEEKGVAAGEKQGMHEGMLEWQGLIQETETIIQELHTSRMALLKSAEDEMLRLIVAFAKRIVKLETRFNPAVIMKNIDAAIGLLSETDKIVLRINLRDKAMVQARKDELLRRLTGVRELTVLEDPSLTPGGVRIESTSGTIDATIETQAAELEKQLLALVQAKPAD